MAEPRREDNVFIVDILRVSKYIEISPDAGVPISDANKAIIFVDPDTKQIRITENGDADKDLHTGSEGGGGGGLENPMTEDLDMDGHATSNSGQIKFTTGRIFTEDDEVISKKYVDDLFAAALTNPLQGDLGANGFKITDLAPATQEQDAVCLAQLTSSITSLTDYIDATFFRTDGSVEMGGILNAGGYRISNLDFPSSPEDAVRLDYMEGQINDALLSYLKLDGSSPMTGDLDMDGHSFLNASLNGFLGGSISGQSLYALTEIIDPTNPQDAATKAYADTKVTNILTTTQSGTVNAATITEGSLLNGIIGGQVISAGRLKVGTAIRIKLFGELTTSALGPTLRIDVQIGDAVIATTGNKQPLSGITGARFDLDVLLICVAVNDGEDPGVMLGHGSFMQINPTTFAVQGYAMPYDTNLNTNASSNVDVMAVWGAGTAGNVISGVNGTVEIFDPIGMVP